MEVELVSAQQDIDIAYQDALDNNRLKRAKVDQDEAPKGTISEQQQKDIYVSRPPIARTITDRYLFL